MPQYEWLKEGEQILMVIRRHWWYFVKLFFQLLGLVIVVVASFIFLDFNFAFLIMLAAVLIALVLIWYYWFLWRHDEYMLTNKRIIDINRNNIFNKEVIEFTLDKVQNVYYQQHGPIPMLVNFGEVMIETAGEYRNVKIELAPNPALIQKKISETLSQWRRKHGFKPLDESKNTLVTKYDNQR